MLVWIARDKNGKVFIYKDKPQKAVDLWIGLAFFRITDLLEDINPQWEDDEPIRVDLKIENI